MAPSTIQSLPNELLAHILGYLDAPSYFEPRLRDDPDKLVPEAGKLPEEAPGKDLKNASLVCRLWRRSVLPLLFRYVAWSFSSLAKPAAADPEAAAASEIEIEFLAFLHSEGLARTVESLTIIINHARTNVDSPDVLRWGVVGGSLDLYHTWDNNWFWHALFQHLDPLRITLIAHPSVLAALLSRTIDLTSAWLFKSELHILSLSRPSGSSQPADASTIPIPSGLPSQSPHHSALFPYSHPCDLFSIRKWTSILINEGSSISAYATYEYFHHVTPSTCHFLFNQSDPSFSPFLEGTLTSLSYIAIFPLSDHVISSLLTVLPPSVHYLYVQILPRNQDVLGDGGMPASADASDPWLEHTDICFHITRSLLVPQGTPGRYDDVRVFETGDADSEEFQRTFNDIGESGMADWKVASPGVLVRKSP